MSTPPKERFKGLRFIFGAVVTCAVLLAANAGAQTAVWGWLRWAYPCGDGPNNVDLGCLSRFVPLLGAEALVVIANGLVLGVIVVLLVRYRNALAGGLLAGFAAFILAVTVVPVARALIVARLPSQLVPMPPVSPIPPAAGQGQIAFVTAGHEIRLINADGSGMTHLTNGNSVSWSPDGSQLAYGAPCGDLVCLYLLSAAGNVTQFSNPAGISDETPLWSPDGSKLLFQAGNSNEVRVMNIDGSHRLALRSTIEGVAWSPDGQRLAYVNDGQIYVMNADGSGATRLPAARASDVDPVTWSPDGKQIVYNPVGSNIMAAVNVDGSGAPSLPTRDGRGLPAWSADGRRIAFSDGQFQITVVNTDGTGLTRLTHDANSDVTPRWSPDGTQIAFINNPYSLMNSGPARLCVINADGSHEHCFTDDIADGLYSFIGFPPVVFAWRP